MYDYAVKHVIFHTMISILISNLPINMILPNTAEIKTCLLPYNISMSTETTKSDRCQSNIWQNLAGKLQPGRWVYFGFSLPSKLVEIKINKFVNNYNNVPLF